jgi:hypothetical protein
MDCSSSNFISVMSGVVQSDCPLRLGHLLALQIFLEWLILYHEGQWDVQFRTAFLGAEIAGWKCLLLMF